MAAISLPRPGKTVRGVEIGPCLDACRHRDCAQTRRTAASPCGICRQPIGYETPFFGSDAGPEHARCVYAAAQVGDHPSA